MTHGACCEGLEDRRFSLLACIMPSSPRSLMGSGHKDEPEGPTGSSVSGLLGCTSMNVGADILAFEGTVKSEADEAAESMVDITEVTAS